MCSLLFTVCGSMASFLFLHGSFFLSPFSSTPFFGTMCSFARHVETSHDVEKRKSRSLLELRSKAVGLKRARFIYFPKFSRNALQSRMKRYAEIGALCCASCHSFKKKSREKGRARMIVARAPHEYVIRSIRRDIREGIN